MSALEDTLLARRNNNQKSEAVDAGYEDGWSPEDVNDLPVIHVSETPYNMLSNIFASLVIALGCLVTIDSFLGCTFAVGYTLFYWHYWPDTAVNMSWQIVSLAVIFPISQGIGMGFKRLTLTPTQNQNHNSNHHY